MAHCPRNKFECNAPEMTSNVLQPRQHLRAIGLGYFPFRSPLLRKYIFVSFPLGTKMFQFPRFASIASYVQSITSFNARGVPPFGHSRINGWYPPPRDFSQVSHVLHRHCQPRHPPYALIISYKEFCALYIVHIYS